MCEAERLVDPHLAGDERVVEQVAADLVGAVGEIVGGEEQPRRADAVGGEDDDVARPGSGLPVLRSMIYGPGGRPSVPFSILEHARSVRSSTPASSALGQTEIEYLLIEPRGQPLQMPQPLQPGRPS